jgi:hypothetical protein
MYLSSRMEFENGTQIWQEAEIKPFDCRKLQAAMFMDRPDLWQKPKKKPHRIASEQIALIQESAND